LGGERKKGKKELLGKTLIERKEREREEKIESVTSEKKRITSLFGQIKEVNKHHLRRSGGRKRGRPEAS